MTQGSIPQVLADKKEQGVLPRMDTKAESISSRTAPANEATPTGPCDEVCAALGSCSRCNTYHGPRIASTVLVGSVGTCRHPRLAYMNTTGGGVCIDCHAYFKDEDVPVATKRAVENAIAEQRAQVTTGHCPASPVAPYADSARHAFEAGWRAAKADDRAADDEDVADAPDVAWSDYQREIQE